MLRIFFSSYLFSLYFSEFYGGVLVCVLVTTQIPVKQMNLPQPPNHRCTQWRTFGWGGYCTSIRFPVLFDIFLLFWRGGRGSCRDFVNPVLKVKTWPLMCHFLCSLFRALRVSGTSGWESECKKGMTAMPLSPFFPDLLCFCVISTMSLEKGQ